MHQGANLYRLFTPTPLPMGFLLGLVNRRHQQKIRRQKKRSGYFFPASWVPDKGCDPSLLQLPPRGPSSSALSLGSVTTSSSCPFALEGLLASHCSWCLGALSPRSPPLTCFNHCKWCLHSHSAFPPSGWTQVPARIMADAPTKWGSFYPGGPEVELYLFIHYHKSWFGWKCWVAHC